LNQSKPLASFVAKLSCHILSAKVRRFGISLRQPAEHLLERSATRENDGNRRNDENRKIMKTSSTILIALSVASASASPIWKMQKPVTHGFSVFAEAKKSRIAVDSQGVAIQGYDPVAYFTQNKPVKGSPSNQSVYQGAKFYFASAAKKPDSNGHYFGAGARLPKRPGHVSG
jgi:hypothetical protein